MAACDDNAVDDGPPESVSRGQFLDELPVLRCNKLRLCGAIAAENVERCVALGRRYPWSLQNDYADAARYAYDSVAGATCLRSLRHLDCVRGQAWSLYPAQPCPGVFRGARPPGSDCHASAECSEGPCVMPSAKGLPDVQRHLRGVAQARRDLSRRPALRSGDLGLQPLEGALRRPARPRR